MTAEDWMFRLEAEYGDEWEIFLLGALWCARRRHPLSRDEELCSLHAEATEYTAADLERELYVQRSLAAALSAKPLPNAM